MIFLQKNIKLIIVLLSIFLVCPIANTVIAASSVTFSWLPNSADEQVDGYRIHYGTTKGGPYTETVDVGTPTPVDGRISWTINDGFAEGITYYFVATAYNAAGESPFSQEVTWTATPVDTSTPGDVANVKFHRNGSNVSFEWTNPSDDDYAGVKIVYTWDGVTEPAIDDDGAVADASKMKIFSEVAAPGTTTGGVLEPGTYKFAFFTYDSAGNYSHTFRMTIPVVTVSHAPDPVNNPKTQVTFNVTINPECLGDVTYSWNFGDGSTATATTGTITHTFDTQKQYTVTLTLTNDTCTIIREYTLTVNDLPPTTPTGIQ